MDGGIYGGGGTAPPAKKLNVMRGRSHHSSSLRPLSDIWDVEMFSGRGWNKMELNGTTLFSAVRRHERERHEQTMSRI